LRGKLTHGGEPWFDPTGGLRMSRVNIKAEASTRDRLRALKRNGETWDDVLNRLAEYGELVDQEK